MGKPYMNILPFITGVTQTITTKTAPRSIPPSVVGNAFTTLAQLTKENVEALSGGLGNAIPSDLPANNVFNYNISQAGTYVNFGGIVITTADIASGLVQLRKINDVWTKVITPISLTNYETVANSNTKVATLQNQINSVSTGIGSALPTDIPSANIKTYNVSVPGTYTNFSNIIITSGDTTSGLVQLTLAGTGLTWSKVITPIALGGYMTKDDLYNRSSLLNLYKDSNRGLVKALILSSNGDETKTNIYPQAGTPIATIEENFQGFNVAIKLAQKVGDYNLIYSPIVRTDDNPAGTTNKVSGGVYVKVSSNYNGIIKFGFTSTDGTELTNFTTGFEFVQLANNWRYYRIKDSVILNPTSLKYRLSLFVDNRTATSAADIYFAAPAIVRTDFSLVPAIYEGVDSPLKSVAYADLVEHGFNNLSDTAFLKQTVNAELIAPWSIVNGGSNIFLPPHRVVTSQSPFANRAIEVDISKRSSDNFSAIAHFTQSYNVPKHLVGKTVLSAGFWFKREHKDITIPIFFQFFTAENASGVATNLSAPVTIVGVETVGQWTYAVANNVTVPAGTLSISVRFRFEGAGLTTLDTVYKCQLATPSVVYGQKEIFGYTKNILESIPTGGSTGVAYSDLVEHGGNTLFDTSFVKQTVGIAPSTPWALVTGGSSIFAAPSRVVTSQSPFTNRAVEFDISKRSSDGFRADAQLAQTFNIPKHLVGKVVMSAGFWMKRDSNQILFPSFYQLFTGENGTGTATNVFVTGTIVGTETVGQWVYVAMNNIAVPENVLSIAFRFRFDASSMTTLDTVFKAQVAAPSVVFNQSSIFGYTKNLLEDQLSGTLKAVWGSIAGKKTVSFGDSITAYNEYQKFLIEKFGLVHTNRGIGGSGVSTGSQIAWVDAQGNYVSRPGSPIQGQPDTQPAGTFQIESQAYKQQRIDTIPIDTELILIMYGTNDFSSPLGVLSDYANNTFFGRYQEMLDKLVVRLPNVEVVLLTPIYRKSEPTDPQNQAFRDAIKRIGLKYAYPVIDVGGECGINKNNTTVMIPDDVHPSIIGMERMSRVMIRGLQYIFRS